MPQCHEIFHMEIFGMFKCGKLEIFLGKILYIYFIGIFLGSIQYTFWEYFLETFHIHILKSSFGIFPRNIPYTDIEIFLGNILTTFLKYF